MQNLAGNPQEKMLLDELSLDERIILIVILE
jgi:hypothetical protein